MFDAQKLSQAQQEDLAGLAYDLAHHEDTRADFADLVRRRNPARALQSFPDIEFARRLGEIENRLAALERKDA